MWRSVGSPGTDPYELDDVVRLYEEISRGLGTSYSLGYDPSRTAQDGKTRRIEVKPLDRNLRLTQSRTMYTW
jgi:hypothetical protein